jgi:hypothetical protein
MSGWTYGNFLCKFFNKDSLGIQVLKGTTRSPNFETCLSGTFLFEV